MPRASLLIASSPGSRVVRSVNMHRKTGEATQKALEFMRDYPGQFCNNCMRELLRCGRNQLNERDFSRIAAELGYIRNFGTCSRCGMRRALSIKA